MYTEKYSLSADEFKIRRIKKLTICVNKKENFIQTVTVSGRIEEGACKREKTQRKSRTTFL